MRSESRAAGRAAPCRPHAEARGTRSRSRPRPALVSIRSEEGATAIEYAIVGTLLGIAFVTGAGALGLELGSLYESIADFVGGAMS